AKARLRGGPTDKADLVVAVDGVPVATPEALAEQIQRRAVGESVKLLVLGQGQYREVRVVLEAAPDLPDDYRSVPLACLIVDTQPARAAPSGLVPLEMGTQSHQQVIRAWTASHRSRRRHERRQETQ